MTGNTTAHSPSVAGKQGFSLISDNKFRQIYAALLQCEMLDQRLSSFAQSASPYRPWNGGKASSAAIASCLRRGDTVLPTPRGWLANYLHSGSPTGSGKNLGAPELFAAAGNGALIHKLSRSGNVTAVFAPSAHSSAMRESFAPAAKQSLPILYILEGGTPPAEICHGIPVISVDASDAVAAYRVAYESITRAREGYGPTIIECVPWPDDAHAADPLLKLEDYLSARKLFRPSWKRRLEQKCAVAINQAVKLIPQCAPIKEML